MKNIKKPSEFLKQHLPRRAETVGDWFPVSEIRDGIVLLKDGRYIKILEVMPINFYLMSEAEQQTIISYFASYLKIAPANMQIRVTTEKADMNSYIQRMQGYYNAEQNEQCRLLIEDNINLVQDILCGVAVTHKFYLIFQFEPRFGMLKPEFQEIRRTLNEDENTARKYLDLCGLSVRQPEKKDLHIREILSGILGTSVLSEEVKVYDQG